MAREKTNQNLPLNAPGYLAWHVTQKGDKAYWNKVGAAWKHKDDGFRFSDNPFFLKFCPRVVFNPDDKALFKGIYLPLDLWKRADAAGLFKGPRGGKVLTFKNVGRRINNSEFVGLVAGSWVGTSIEQSAVLSEIVRQVLETGKTVTIAIKHTSPPHASEMEAAE